MTLLIGHRAYFLDVFSVVSLDTQISLTDTVTLGPCIYRKLTACLHIIQAETELQTRFERDKQLTSEYTSPTPPRARCTRHFV